MVDVQLVDRAREVRGLSSAVRGVLLKRSIIETTLSVLGVGEFLSSNVSNGNDIRKLVQ